MIKIGEEYITRSAGSAYGGYVMTIVSIERNKKTLDSMVIFSITDMKRVRGNSKLTTRQDTARLWWFEEYCQKIERSLSQIK